MTRDVQATVAALHKHCPSLGLVGDLKHWDISPPVRRKLIKVGGGKIFNSLYKKYFQRYNTCNIALPVAVGQFF